MNKSMIALAGFIVGAISGVAATYIYSKKRFEKELNDAIESVNESYKRAYGSLMKENAPEHSEDDKDESAEEPQEPQEYVEVTDIYEPSGIDEYENNTENVDYTRFYDAEVTEDTPRTITEDEYYDNDLNYNRVDLLLYDDGVITDDLHEKVEDPYSKVVQADVERFLADEFENEYFSRVPADLTDYCLTKEHEPYSRALERWPYLRDN